MITLAGHGAGAGIAFPSLLHTLQHRTSPRGCTLGAHVNHANGLSHGERVQCTSASLSHGQICLSSEPAHALLQTRLHNCHDVDPPTA